MLFEVNGFSKRFGPITALTDVSFHVEVSPDLVPASWSESGITIDQNTSTLLQVHVTTPVDSSPRNFIRLRVSRP